MVHELIEGPGTVETPVRTLRRGFAEKLAARHISKVWKAVDGGVLTLIWEQVDGVWIPRHECDYYDEKQVGENDD